MTDKCYPQLLQKADTMSCSYKGSLTCAKIYILYTLLLPRELFFSEHICFFLRCVIIWCLNTYPSLKCRETISKPLVGWLFQKTLSKHCFVCLTFPTTATLIQWCEFGVGLSVCPTNDRQEEYCGNYCYFCNIITTCTEITHFLFNLWFFLLLLLLHDT